MKLYPGCYQDSLPNGLEIVGQEEPDSKSVSLGVWFDSGSRDEAPDVNGITHLIEHLLFRGTENRSAYEISSDVDRIGGLINGSTSTEFFLLSLQLLPESLERGVEILADLVVHPLLRQEDMMLEKDVVLEEIHSSQDNHQRETIRLFERAVWGEDCGLSQPVLGTESTVKSISSEDVRSRFTGLKAPGRITITAAGKLEFDRLVELIEDNFSVLQAETDQNARNENPHTPGRTEGELVNHDWRDIHQLHVVTGAESIPRGDERRYPLEMLNVLLGNGMSSRLFRKVRKERGLAYQVVSNTQYYSDTGMFYVYGAIDPDNLDQYRRLVAEEFEDLSSNSVSDRELQLAKQKTKGNLVLGLENNEALMGRLGISNLYGTDLLSVEKVLEKIDSITKEEIKSVASDLLKEREIKTSLLGPEVGI